MNSTGPLRALHCEQVYSNSCLAACVAIVRLRCGAIAREEAEAHERMLMEKPGSSPKGLSPGVVAFELGSRLIEADPDDANNFTRVRFDVDSGRWWHIAILCPGPLSELQGRQVPRPRSRHGELTSPLPHHAVVLVGAEEGRLLYLDPWFPQQFQPQVIADADFVRAWTGRYIPVRLPEHGE